MVAVNRVYAARLAGMVVLGPDGESIGRVRDVVISISIVRQQPRVLGLVVELLTRRRIFVPILRVTAIEPSAVTLTTANVSLRRFAQRPGEVLVLGQVLDTRVRVDDPELRTAGGRRRGRRRPRHRTGPHPRLDGDQGRGAQPPQAGPPHHRAHRRLADTCGTHAVGAGAARPGRRAAARAVRGPAPHRGRRRHPRAARPKRRNEVVNALDDERLADVLQELPEDEQAELLASWTPNAPPTCSRRWIPTTPPTCSAR